MRIDVNGLKKTKIIGHDSFRIIILKDKVAPYGIPPANINVCRGKFGGTSWGDECSAKYLLE
ncbi:MAG: hypothetical protein KH301_08530 [Brachyspira sp.]|nr:hypothetical protein [Brachyspira sp.]